MSFSSWIFRCLPAFSVIFILGLSYAALVVEPYGRRTNCKHEGRTNASQLILAVFFVILHVFAACFPIRLCFALYDLLQRIRAASHELMYNDQKLSLVQDLPIKLESPSAIHAIIIPSHREKLDTLTDTLSVLAVHPAAATTYDVIYLAMESDGFDAIDRAQTLIKSFAGRFRRMTYTRHPSGACQETKGRSSIVGWAAEEAMRFYKNNLWSADVLMTILSADTHLLPSYFDTIVEMHDNDPFNAPSTIYVPPVTIEHNGHNVPRLARLADVLRTCGTLSSYHARSIVKIPTSVYTLPMALVEYVDGWDTDAESIQEGAHMYLKCCLALSGNLKTKVIYSPAVQCDIAIGGDGIRASWAARAERFDQGLRQSWGALDVGFTLGTLFMRELTKMRDAPQPSNFVVLFVVLKRLVETHFLLVHFFIYTMASCMYTWYISRGLGPGTLGYALSVCDWIRLGCYVCMLVALALYRRYHTVCLHMRKVFLYRSNLLEDFTTRNVISDTDVSPSGFAGAMLFPVAGVIYGVVPSLVAILSHVWTDKLPVSVSLGRQNVDMEIDHDAVLV